MFFALWRFWLELDQTLRSKRKGKPHSMSDVKAMDASDVQPLAVEAEQPLIVAGYNIGLTSDIVFDAKSKKPLSGLYDFTSKLVEDVNEAFGAGIGMHALFLSDVVNQRENCNLDVPMKQTRSWFLKTLSLIHI